MGVKFKLQRLSDKGSVTEGLGPPVQVAMCGRYFLFYFRNREKLSHNFLSQIDSS